MRRIRTWFLSAMLAAGCAMDSNEEVLYSVPLSETSLVGSYFLADYLFEYGDGLRLDPSVLAVTGTLTIGEDSSYREGIRIGNDSTPTTGRITRVLASEKKAVGLLELTLEGADSSASGKSRFSFQGDTLVLVTEVSKERDVSKKGFRETAYYARFPASKP